MARVAGAVPCESTFRGPYSNWTRMRWIGGGRLGPQRTAPGSRGMSHAGTEITKDTRDMALFGQQAPRKRPLGMYQVRDVMCPVAEWLSRHQSNSFRN
jgi:hypothetical protein